MPLSRLENFLKNAEGNILYVNPSDFDATDSFENQGNSLARPFKTIQRALIEAARFSYQQGKNNDRIDRTTILVYPGTHYIDNRPGYSIENISNAAVYKRKVGPQTWINSTISELSETTNYDILDPSNDLYKFNSVYGGAILPRGTSIIGLDLRKTKIRPLYVPDPEDDTVESTSIFNVTGTCYFTAFSIFDGDPTKTVFKNYSESKVVPNYSHHKIVTFAYADGVNKVKLGSTQTYLSDLDMYYYKVTRAYGDITGRGLSDFPSANDFEPSVDEFRIVGSLDANPLGISSIRAGNGDGTGDVNVITVTTSNKQTNEEVPHNLFVDSPFIISGVTVDSDSYNGSFTVKDVVGLTTFTFTTNEAPTEFLPLSGDIDTASLIVGSDTVSSASPYIFNCSLRSVYGMNGLWADGAKATGFKSMVVAQFTGVSLQKDDNAFILYNNGIFYDNTSLPSNSIERPLHTNSRSIYKPKYESYHIRASNDAFIQNVSVFAIGFSRHFLTESGSDMSITNSNSNFGATSLESEGFKTESFDRDDSGYITHIIPPREIINEENVVTWLSLDTEKIINASLIDRLYIFGADNQEISPTHQIDGYRVGAKEQDKLYLTVTIGAAQTTYESPILMPASGGNGVSARKEYLVDRSGLTNNIVSNLFTLTSNHQFINGEKVRVISDTGQVPDGLENEAIYYAITNGFGSSQLKLAQSLNDALAGIPLLGINNNGGKIKITSIVSDKLPGEIGHPIQWDDAENNWYVTGSLVPSENQINGALVGLGLTVIGNETSSTFIRRVLDNRSINEKIYRIRYVIPKEFVNARQPTAGFILQESKTVGVTSISYTNDLLTNTKDLRNEKVIVNATSSAVINNEQVVTITTELPHNFSVGDKVKIQKIKSTNNTDALGIVSTYNGLYSVNTVPNSKTFTYSMSGVSTNPGTFTNDINLRSTRQQREGLPVVSRESYNNTFFVYRVSQVKRLIPGQEGQDGVYHLTALASNVSPSAQVGFNLSDKKFNQDVKNLYPQLDRDNIDSDPDASVSYADLSVIGKVITNDKKKSITKEAISEFYKNTRVGVALSDVVISGTGNTTITIRTKVEHNLNSIKSISFSAGAGYPASQTLYSKQLQSVISSGNGATARVQTNSSGQVVDVKLIDDGSSYSVNDTLGIPGGSSSSVVTVTTINNSVGSSVELSGFTQNQFNDVFKIVSIPNSKEIVLYASTGVSTFIPNTNGSDPFFILASNEITISNIKRSDIQTGITTVTTVSAHGLLPGNKVKIIDTGSLDTETVIKDTIGLTTFTYVSVGSSITGTSSNGYVLKRAFSSNGRSLGNGEENLFSRASYIYDGFFTNTAAVFDLTSTTIDFSDSTGVNRGDYFVINSEIVRIASNSNPFTILRGQFGSFKTIAPIGSLVRRIRVLPVELRRPSFMRASSHTFEYLGYGPGNYSTGMPQKQNRVLSEDEVLVSQAKERRGGTVVYTGMNDLGEFYSGATKLSSATGEQTVVEAPVLTYTGDDAQGQGSSSSSGIFDELLVRQRITVEGGENNNQASQFYGPVNFTQKVTNLSEFGFETKNLFVKGTAAQPKLITVGISTPTSASIPSSRTGDVSLLSNPDEYIGHVRVGTEWRPFGLISNSANELDLNLDKLSVNTPSGSGFDFAVGGDTRIENLIVTGGVIFQQPQSLGNVSFENVTINRTATFTATGLDPLTGFTTDYTQIHLDGISLLNDLQVVGVSTFNQKVDFNSNIFGIGADFGNIRIAIADDNTIDTTAGNLVINSIGGITNIIDDLVVNGSKLELISGTPLSIGGTITASIVNSRDLRLGYGSTDLGSSLSFHNDDRFFPDGALKVYRSAGIGSNVNSEILHRGQGILKLNAFDPGSQVSLYTANLERVRVGSSGTITFLQNNSGQNLAGAHVKINQNGPGDVALSWDITHNNANRRWYAGIDTSDGYSWKLANPLTTLAYGLENYDNPGETKLKVDSEGSLTVTKNAFIGGDTLDSGSGVFNLLNSVQLTVNAFQNSENVNIANNTLDSVTTIRGLTESNTTGTGALVVAGGVGIGKRLNVFGNTSIGGDLNVDGGDFTTNSTSFNIFNSNVTSANLFNSASNLVIGSTVGTTNIRHSLDVDGNLNVDGASITSGAATFNLLNSVVKVANVLGVATAIGIGSTVGITTIRNAVDINSGTIDGTTIGLTERAAARFTSIDVNADSTFNGRNVTQLVLRNYGETVTNLGNVSGTVNFDLNIANVFVANMTGNCTFTVSNFLTGASTSSSFTVFLRNGSANLSVAWPLNFKFPNNLAPVRTVEAGKTDIWIFLSPDQGNTWYGNVALYNYTT
jgi:hypothetical protein